MTVGNILSNFYIAMRERGVNVVGLVLTQKSLSLVHILNQLEKMPVDDVHWNPELKHYQLTIHNTQSGETEGVVHLLSTGEINDITTNPGGETGQRGGEDDKPI